LDFLIPIYVSYEANHHQARTFKSETRIPEKRATKKDNHVEIESKASWKSDSKSYNHGDHQARHSTPSSTWWCEENFSGNL